MLKHKMAVKQDGLDFGEKGIVAIDMRPACLHHADTFVGEVMNDAPEKIRRRYEISVKDGNVFTLRRSHSFL